MRNLCDGGITRVERDVQDGLHPHGRPDQRLSVSDAGLEGNSLGGGRLALEEEPGRIVYDCTGDRGHRDWCMD
jgi:hypothetical protein